MQQPPMQQQHGMQRPITQPPLQPMQPMPPPQPMPPAPAWNPAGAAYAQPQPPPQQLPYAAHPPYPGAPPQPPYGYGFGYAPGSRVTVTWSNGQRYPGTVQQVSGTQCLVVFPDGQHHWVEMQYLSPA
jgi:hypothetical protein